MFTGLWNRLTRKPVFEPKGIIEDRDAYVHRAYESAINYYRHSAKSTKGSYRTYRFLTITLGALVTLISSLAATEYVKAWPEWAQTSIVLATPLIAAILT